MFMIVRGSNPQFPEDIRGEVARGKRGNETDEEWRQRVRKPLTGARIIRRGGRRNSGLGNPGCHGRGNC